MSKPLPSKPAPVQTFERHRVSFALPTEEERVSFRASAKDDEVSPWVNPSDMSETERGALVAKIKAGEVVSLRFRAVSFGDGGNRNNTELTAKHVKQLAKSAGKGHQNLLNGHGGFLDGSPATPIVGEVIKGTTDKTEAGETRLLLDHRLADPYAMEQFARGLWRTFSISIMAESWEYAWLDEDGKEIDDPWDAVSYFVRPVGEVGLVHNAFVADPAYLGTAVIQPHGARSIEEARKMAGENKKAASEGESKATDALAVEIGELRSQLVEAKAQLAAEKAARAGLEAQLAAEKAAHDAERSAHFTTVFDAAVSTGKVAPAEKPVWEAFSKTGGTASVAAMLSQRAGTLVPMATVGAAAHSTPAGAVAGEAGTGGKPAQHFGGSEEAERKFVELGATVRGIKTA